MANLLALKHVSWQIKHRLILNNISLNIQKGDIIGIIGPNGAGKTSLIKCLLNHNKDYTGDITLDGKSLKSYSTKALARHFAFVAQHTPPVFDLTVYDMVSMGLLPHKGLFTINNDRDNNDIDNALQQVGLSHTKQQLFHTLSGGEQQRVLIAKSLVQKAEILVLDEPINHLDIFYQHQIFQILNKLNFAHNTTIIMTIHDLNLAAQYCHRLILLNEGKVIANNSSEKVLTPDLLTSVFKLPCYKEQQASDTPPRVYFTPDNNSVKNIMDSNA